MVHSDPMGSAGQEANMNSAIFQRALIVFAFVTAVACAGAAQAASSSFKVPLSGAQGVPPVETSGDGNG